MKTITFFLVSVILFSFQASLAQQTQTHWLVGQWEGKIEGYLSKENPGRTLRVIAVSPDGTAQARWAVTGQGMGGADIAVDGLKVTVVTSAKSQVELSREGDNLLVGTFTLQTGRRFPIKLTKINGPTGQLKFEVSYASSRLALLSGEVKEALASFESQAQEAEKNAAASVVSHKSLDFGCHSERSEESRLFKYMRPFTSFRVTRKTFFSILLM